PGSRGGTRTAQVPPLRNSRRKAKPQGSSPWTGARFGGMSSNNRHVTVTAVAETAHDGKRGYPERCDAGIACDGRGVRVPDSGTERRATAGGKYGLRPLPPTAGP